MRRRRVTRRLRISLLLAVALAAAGAALAVVEGGVLRRAELAAVDLRFSIRGEQPRPDDLLVVAVDDVTFSDLNERWPFDRHRFAKVIDRLADGGARLIVYDIQFTEPQGDSPDDIDADNALIEASRRAGNVVYSTTEVGDRGETAVFGGADGQKYGRATVGNGLVPEDPGAVLRRVHYAVDGLRSLGVVAVEKLGARVDRSAFGEDGAWIDYLGPDRHVPTVSFSKVLRGRVDPGQFRDRIVVVGASVPSLQDRHPVSFGESEMSGPEVHANIISTLLRGVPLRSSAGWVDIVLALFLSLLVPVAALRLRSLATVVLGVCAGLGYMVTAQVVFGEGRVLPVVGPMLGVAIGTVGTLGVHTLTTSVEKAQVRDLFSRFVPDTVVEQVLKRADSDDPRLGGVRLVCTVLFSDLRGFTSFSESREPEQVITVLNRYLTLMSDAILDHGGTLVAYMGDGIMAVFGAPIAIDDHADRALAAAEAMLAQMEEFNAWMRDNGHGEGFKMGIGLNTGHVMSGNVGSARRLEYTAIGEDRKSTRLNSSHK
jgi:adenylate cyclase